ncbi:hypothetical protein QZH41_015199, partial [Actinostola sp. cb2023]
MSGKRKTLTAADVLQALEEMEFEEFIPKLKEDLTDALFTHMIPFFQLSKKNKKARKRQQQNPKEENQKSAVKILHQKLRNKRQLMTMKILNNMRTVLKSLNRQGSCK